MKILMTTSFYPPFHVGGDAVHVKYLAESLVKMGHEVHVMFSMDAYNLKRKEKRQIPDWNGVKMHILKSPLGRLEPIMNYCFGTQKYTYDYFKKLVGKEKFDVVHHHNISLLGYNILKKIGNYKNIYTAHDYWLICHKYNLLKDKKPCKTNNCFECCVRNGRPYQYYRNFQKFKKSVSNIDVIITPSVYMKKVLQRHFKNIQVLGYFIPKINFNKKRIYKNYFLYVGVLEDHKGIKGLIDIFKKNQNNKLLIVGEGSLKREIEDIVKNYSNIKMLGWKNAQELFSLYYNAKAVIIPSIWPENFPFVALEPLSVGTPVIGSNQGGIPEIIRKIDPELIFDFRNFKQLEKIILNFNHKKYSKFKVKRIFLNNFAKNAYIKNYFEVIGK